MLSKEKIEEIYKDVCKTIKQEEEAGEDTQRLRGMKDMLEVILEKNGMYYEI